MQRQSAAKGDWLMDTHKTRFTNSDVQQDQMLSEVQRMYFGKHRENRENAEKAYASSQNGSRLFVWVTLTPGHCRFLQRAGVRTKS